MAWFFSLRRMRLHFLSSWILMKGNYYLCSSTLEPKVFRFTRLESTIWLILRKIFFITFHKRLEECFLFLNVEIGTEKIGLKYFKYVLKIVVCLC